MSKIEQLAIELRRAEQDVTLTNQQYTAAMMRREEAQKAFRNAVDEEIQRRQDAQE